jgi:hypothetical protein
MDSGPVAVVKAPTRRASFRGNRTSATVLHVAVVLSFPFRRHSKIELPLLSLRITKIFLVFCPPQLVYRLLA